MSTPDSIIALSLKTGEFFTPARGQARGTKHWRGIVKVQRSINPGGIALIYNERRTIMHEQAMRADLEEMFLPDEWRFYADATFHNGVLKINARANKAQEW